MNNCDEEVRQGDGEKCRSKEEVEGGGEHKRQTLRVELFEKSTTKGRERQRKKVKSFTKEEKSGLKGFDEFSFVNHSVHICNSACTSPSTQVTLANLVVAVEVLNNSLCEAIVATTQNVKNVAQYDEGWEKVLAQLDTGVAHPRSVRIYDLKQKGVNCL